MYYLVGQLHQTVNKVVFLRLVSPLNAILKHYIFEGVTSFFDLDPLPPISNFGICLANPLTTKGMTCFLNG